MIMMIVTKNDNLTESDMKMNKREQEQCEKECKKENQKQFRRIMGDDDPYDDDTEVDEETVVGDSGTK